MKHVFIMMFLCLVPTWVWAGGPLNVAGTTPVKYSGNVVLNFDPGSFRTNGDNNAADALVNQALDLWNNVSTATISISQGADLSQDINVNNYQTVLPTAQGLAGGTESDNLNPVVYDFDGQIIDEFFGVGAKDEVAGFAASFSSGLNYTEGFAVLNGAMALTDNQVVILVAHEVGHYIGLDHTQGNQKQFCGVPSRYPLMYPFICRINPSLTPDDEAALTNLYPTANVSTLLGRLTGNLLDAGGGPVLGASVWMQNTSTNEIFSVISDYRRQQTGYFDTYLPAGTYAVHAQSINDQFYDASSIGPYARNPFDRSFTDPHPITDADYEGDTKGSIELVTISAGATQDIQFKLYEVHAQFPAGSTLGKRSGAISYLFLLLLLWFRLRKTA